MHRSAHRQSVLDLLQPPLLAYGGAPGGYGGPPPGGMPGGMPPAGGGMPPGGFGAPGGGMPTPPQPPPSSSGGGGGFRRFLGMGLGGIIALSVGGIVVAQNVLGIEIPVVGKYFNRTTTKGGDKTIRGDSAFKEYGTTRETADPDVLIAEAGKRARKWRKDAELYSVNFLGVTTGGTMDFDEGSTVATIEYFSPELVGSSNAKQREKSIKKFVFNSVGVKEEFWGVKKAYPDVPGTPIPDCTMKDIGKLLKKRGLDGDGTAQVSLDPQFGFATNSLSYHAMVSDPKINVWLNIEDCAVLKEQ